MCGLALMQRLPIRQVTRAQAMTQPSCNLLLQVAEVRETQPECRLYIAITKCDQLDEPPSIAEQDTGEPDSSSSSNGDRPSLSICIPALFI